MIGEEPVEQIPFLAAGACGKGVVPSWLPIYFGEMVNIPDAYDAIMVVLDRACPRDTSVERGWEAVCIYAKKWLSRHCAANHFFCLLN